MKYTYKVLTNMQNTLVKVKLLEAEMAFRRGEIALRANDFKGGDIDVNRIALAMEQARLETDIGPVSIRREDHQAIMPVVVWTASLPVMVEEVFGWTVVITPMIGGGAFWQPRRPRTRVASCRSLAQRVLCRGLPLRVS